MSDETLTSRDGLWNESNELYEGLRFENKADLQYVVKRYSILGGETLSQFKMMMLMKMNL